MNGRRPGGLIVAVSMFSVVPVPAGLLGSDPLDRADTAATVRWLPVVGGVLGGLAGLIGTAVLYRNESSGLLSAAIAVACLAILTGGLHLDGLADTADGLGSRAPAERALDIMRRGDIGPFGVVAIVLLLMLDVCALAAASAEGSPWRLCAALVVAATTGRVAGVHAALPWVPAARSSGFGTMVAGTVGLITAAIVSVAVLAVGGVLAMATGANPAGWVITQLIALALVWSLRRALTRRLGGITGDVFGALIEASTMLVLIGLAVL
jgi:adenosylcobinamide-GDP ribazoletransferase